MSTAVTTTEPKAPAVSPPAPANIELGGDIITNPAMFEHVQRIAKLLAWGAFTPKHLIRKNDQETVATCFRVAAQAIRWGFDPFGVADETYEVHGRLGYQGKLIIAVVNSRANLKESLKFTYTGSGAGREVTVTGHIKNEAAPRTITLTVAAAKTANEMWTKDPDQKLAYSGAIKWARRHCPEVVMGVQTIEDLEAIDYRDGGKKQVADLDALTNHLLGTPQDTTPPADTQAPPEWEQKLGDCQTEADVAAFLKWAGDNLPSEEDFATANTAAEGVLASLKPAGKKAQKEMI